MKMVADRDLEIDVLKGGGEIGEVAEFEARYYEQAAVACIAGALFWPNRRDEISDDN